MQTVGASATGVASTASCLKRTRGWTRGSGLPCAAPELLLSVLPLGNNYVTYSAANGSSGRRSGGFGHVAITHAVKSLAQRHDRACGPALFAQPRKARLAYVMKAAEIYFPSYLEVKYVIK